MNDSGFRVASDRESLGKEEENGEPKEKLDDHYNQSGQSRDPSRAFPRLIVIWRPLTSPTDTNLPGPSQDHRLDTSTDPQDWGGTSSHPDPSNMSDGAPSRRASEKDTSRMNTGYTTGNVSGQRYVPPNLELTLKLSGY